MIDATKKKNTATTIFFPMALAASPETFETGLTVSVAAQSMSYSGATPGSWGTQTIAASVAEVGSTGIYALNIASGEITDDFLFLKFTATGALDQLYTIQTTTKQIDDLNDFDPASEAVANVTTVGTVTNEVDADVTAIYGSALAAEYVKDSFLLQIEFVAEGTSTATSIVAPSGSDLSTTDDYYNGIVLYMEGGSAGGQPCAVTDYTGSTKTFTVTALVGTTAGATFRSV